MTDTVLFDLDGTLSDSASGILAALRYAFAENGVPPLDPHTERALLGPPFYDSLPPLIGGRDKFDAVIGSYRDHYAGGSMFDTAVYPGMISVLERARAAGRRMAVATSKPEVYAIEIVERLGLAPFFATIAGDELDGSLRTKALVIGKVIRRFDGIDPDRTIMIGDREHDVVGAAAHGLRCIGAAWGYGLPGELVRAGAEPICAAPVDLLTPLRLEGTTGAATA